MLHVRHLDDIRKQKESAGEVKRSLDAQMHYVHERQRAEAELEAQEVAAMQAHFQQLEAEAAAAEAAERDRLKRLADEIREFNRLKLTEMREADRRER